MLLLVGMQTLIQACIETNTCEVTSFMHIKLPCDRQVNEFVISTFSNRMIGYQNETGRVFTKKLTHDIHRSKFVTQKLVFTKKCKLAKS